MRLNHVDLVRSLGNSFGNVEDIIRELSNAGFKTSADLLFADSPANTYNKLPQGLMTYSAFLHLLDCLTAFASAQIFSSSDVYEHETAVEAARFGGETGMRQLDQLFSGVSGIYGVIELSGGVSTVIALTILLRHLTLNPEHSSRWIDCNSDFFVDKAALILDKMEGPGKDTALERLRVHICNDDVKDLNNALFHLGSQLDRTWEDSARPCRTRFLVVGSMNSFFSPSLSTLSSQGHADLTAFMHQLSSFAQNYKLTVFVLNNTVASTPRNPLSAFVSAVTKPGLGPTFTYLTDTTIFINNAEKVFGEHDETLTRLRKREMEGITVYVAEILRSRHTMASDWCPFVLRDETFIEELEL
ncbi:hypothetical protein FRC02_003091 [Tulasnella sp. 418]|nr:hypothetical protein FRC02_003091 [Tulasnella sp. 418]